MKQGKNKAIFDVNHCKYDTYTEIDTKRALGRRFFDAD